MYVLCRLEAGTAVSLFSAARTVCNGHDVPHGYAANEATAFIDPENEEKMNAAIAEIIKGKTVLVIAHRLQTIVNADKICVMNDGNIIAADTHENLLKSCAEYQKLWNSSEARANWTIGNEVRA